MTSAEMVGIWAATTPYPAFAQQWSPGPAIPQEMHWFLVVRKEPDGTFSAFFKNPEANGGALVGTRSVTMGANGIHLQSQGESDVPGVISAGEITFAHLPYADTPVAFHRAQSDDLRWYYPRAEAVWTYRPAAVLPDGWRTGTLADAGMRVEPIASAIDAIVTNRDPVLRSPSIQSVSIARQGALVLDEYFYGFTPDTPHDVRSAGKSITTLMIGRAIEDGHRFTPQSRVLPLLPQYTHLKNDDVRKQRITVADLMTMASGFDCNDNDDNSLGNEGTMQDQTREPDWYRYTLDLPMVGEPGKRAVYCTAGINLLGAIVSTQSGEPLTTFFGTQFAEPMQFGYYSMWLMPPPLRAAYMGGGDRFRPRDFLKFGELFLEHGRWNGKEIIDNDWLAQSVIPRTAPEGEGDEYGYGWHLTSVKVRGTDYRVINAGGNGGQLLIIVPACDMAIMVTAGNYQQFPVWRQFLPQITTAAIEATLPAQ